MASLFGRGGSEASTRDTMLEMGSTVEEIEPGRTYEDIQDTSAEDKPKSGRWFSRNRVTPQPEEDTEPVMTKEKSKDKPPAVGFFDLFRFATPQEKVLLFVGGVLSVAVGALYPCFTIMIGNILNYLAELMMSVVSSDVPGMLKDILEVPWRDIKSVIMTSAGRQDVLDAAVSATGLLVVAQNVISANTYLNQQVDMIVLYLALMGILGFIFSFLQRIILDSVSRQVANRVRLLYFEALMSQDMAFYDKHQPGEFASQMAVDLQKLEDAIGLNLGAVLSFIGATVTGFGIGLYFGWKLGLVCVALVPFIAGSNALIGRLGAMAKGEASVTFAAASAVAEEALSMIRTVAAFGGQQKESLKFCGRLDEGYSQGITFNVLYGLGAGLTMLILFLSNAIALWYGAVLIVNRELNVGEVITVFFSTVMGSLALGQIFPMLSALAEAQGSTAQIYKVIDQPPAVDSLSNQGTMPAHIEGTITFENCTFTFPGGDRPIINSLDLTIKAGTTVALIGASGSGKSTTIKLIERFYDPDSGNVRLDGFDLRALNIHWLRSQIGLVGQEPVLFAGTIAENIALGAALEPNPDFDPKKPAGTWANRRLRRKEVRQIDIERAAEMANAHTFISNLPHGYNTWISGGGAMLSGGQKQRIAIARALIRDPRILLLDEATSALDIESEQKVQKALEKASAGRTTVVVAHRLSTIRSADVIGVVDKGHLVEIGSHDQLMARNGHYAAYYKRQESGADDSPKPRAEPQPAVQSRRLAGVISLAGLFQTPVEDQESDLDDIPEKETETLNGEEAAANEKSVDSKALWRALKMNGPEWHVIAMGCVLGLVAGLLWTAFAYVFGSIVYYLMLSRSIDKWAYYLVALAIIGLFTHFFLYVTLGYASERLTRRLRVAVFESLLKQDIGFFDLPENSVAALTTQLCSDTSNVRGVTGYMLGAQVMLFSALVSSVALGVSSCWKLAVYMFALIPVMSIVAILTGLYANRALRKAKHALATANEVAASAVTSIRTVTYLGAASDFMDKYRENLQKPESALRWAIFCGAITYSFAPLVVLATWGMGFAVGVNLVSDFTCSVEEMMLTMCSLIFGGLGIMQAAALMPDRKAAQWAATRIFRLLDRKPQVNVDDGNVPPSNLAREIQGDLDFREIVFSYPARPGATILDGMTVKVNAGETLALVGESGCGKSTLIGLTERFYLPRGGTILLDGADIEECNVQALREAIGLVGQEPNLFTATIRENILYGFANEAAVSDSDVEEVCRAANAWDFISALPLGLDTVVRGGVLSGGQKQRVAIARALIRKPKILLLDEATSALDAESEHKVAEALERAQIGRTTLVIAHRLATIQNSHKIAVVKSGRVAEIGSHAELMERKGLYYAMVMKQGAAH